MKTRSISIFVVCISIFAVIGSAFTQAQDDDRINMIGHFGGDNLYCDTIDGCTLLNTDGDLLWNVPQSVIDETFANACEVGISQEIEAGMGTYGPSVLVISCYQGYEPTLKLKAFDEHGKINEIRFPQDYSPVTAATPEPTEETATPSETPSSTPSETASPTPSETPSPTPSETPSPTPSETPSPTPSETPSPTPSETASPTPSETPSPTPSETSTPTSTPTEPSECENGRDCSVTPTPSPTPPTIEPCSFNPQSPVVTTC